MGFLAKPATHDQWARSCAFRFLRQNAKRLVVIFPWAAFVALCYVGLVWARPENMVAILLLLPIYIALVFYLLKYSSQIVSEAWVLISLIALHKDIGRRMSRSRTPTKTRLQSRFESVRRSVREFMIQSVAAFPLMSDYLSEKLRQTIDVFFYAAGMVVLSEKPSYYSASDEHRTRLEEESLSEESELEAQALEAAQNAEDELTGHVRHFGLYELKSFVEYLADRIFSSETFHPAFVTKYSINLIDFLNFFEHWNDLLLRSENGRKVTESAESEVKEFYSETRRRAEIRSERIWAFSTNFVVAVLSALLGFALGKL